MTCPCGRPAAYASCCGPLIEGRASAETPEALMRSRYTAYATGAVDYLLATHHPSTRPDRESVARSAASAEFVRLVVREASGDRVAFEAHYREGGATHVLRERSRFVRDAEGRWSYVDGVVARASAAEPGRNAPCTCGSGKKYKRCCG